MAYTKDDVRSQLTSSSTASRPTASDIAAPEFFDFSIVPPTQVTPAGSQYWVTRGQNLVIAYIQPAVDDTVWAGDASFEHIFLLPLPSSAIRISTDGQERSVTGEALVIVPPGEGLVDSTGDGPVVQLVQSDEPGWSQRAVNSASYAQPHPNVALLDPWPEPVGGYRLRVYPMSDVPDDPNRFGRLFRSRAFMVNFFKPMEGPRDPSRVSPHYHDDFEQISLTIDGVFVHHIQTPWGPDISQWRPEDHVQLNSPSMTVIPPPTIHTTQSIGHGSNYLIDIFSGPRTDFSARPGWVLNADEYPAPAP